MELVGVSFYGIGCNSTIGGTKIPRVFGRLDPAVVAWIRRTVDTRQTGGCSPAPVTAASSSSSSSSCESCGKRKNGGYMLGDRIIGGQDAKQNEFPWAALLTINGRERCGGNLLNDRFVLTSAHCLVHVREDDIDVEVRLGEHNTEEREDGELTVAATSILRHPRYLQTRRGLEVDLALAVLPPLDLSRHAATISPVCLPSPGAEPEPDYGEDYDSDYGTAYGWGKQRLSYYETKRHFGLEKGKASGLSTVLQKLEFE